MFLELRAKMFDENYDRDAECEKFLNIAGYLSYAKDALKGDASRRKFYRLSKGDKSVILIDANPLSGEEPAAYAAVTSYLKKNNVNVPEIFEQNVTQGFFIIEDFGDDLMNNVVRSEPAREETLYKEALEALSYIQSLPVQDVISADDFTYRIREYDVNRLISEARLFTDWYVPELTKRPISYAARDEFIAILRGVLLPVVHTQNVTVLRDYHADNLMVSGDKLGIIDFQDAVLGNAAYDVVSLLQDARRKVSPDFEAKMLDYYCDHAKISNKDDFMRDYHILGAQRNIKILGIFVRLFVRDKKKNYLEFLPDVWAYLEKDLEHPALSPLKSWFDRWLPVPLRHEALAA